MRTKLKHLFIYHPHLDTKQTIELLISFEKGNLDYIRNCLTQKNVNSSIGVCGFLPLELAIIYDHKHIFDYLVNELDANLNIKNKSFESMPFVALAFQRRSYLFDLLNLDISSLYDCTNKSKRTLMHKAAIYNDIKTVRKLINDYGFYRNLNEYELSYLLYDKYNCTPLYYACWFGYTEIVEELQKCFYETKPKNLKHNIDSIELNETSLFLIQPSSSMKKIQIKDGSLAISLLYDRYECAKLLLTSCLNYSCLTNNYKQASSELDAWYASSMKLYSLSDLATMKNLFHELVLNRAKFSNHLFSIIDSMNQLYHFNEIKNRSPPSGYFDSSVLSYFTRSELENFQFVYTKYNSNYLKALAFICNYNLENLFDSDEKCGMFLKSCFIKLNELFLVNNNWNLIDEILLDKRMNSALDEYFNFNRDSILLFLYDFRQFLTSLYTNGLSFKYFSKKKFFNFLRKFRFIYYLIETNLYKLPNETNRFIQSEPLALVNLAKLKILNSLKYVDINLINRLGLPRDLVNYLSSQLANGLTLSYERAKMNKLF